MAAAAAWGLLHSRQAPLAEDLVVNSAVDSEGDSEGVVLGTAHAVAAAVAPDL